MFLSFHIRAGVSLLVVHGAALLGVWSVVTTCPLAGHSSVERRTQSGLSLLEQGPVVDCCESRSTASVSRKCSYCPD